MSKLENLIAGVASLLFVAIAVLFWQWSAIVGHIVRSDLQDYARASRKADIPLVEKEKLLDQIEALEDRLDAGESIGYWRWKRTDGTVRELLKGGISGDKVRLIERELGRIEKAVKQP